MTKEAKMAVKPQSMYKPDVKPVPYGAGDTLERSAEHMKLIKEVWFNRFDLMFCDSYEMATYLITCTKPISFDIQIGIYESDDDILMIHPNITKQHLGYLSRIIRTDILKNNRTSAVMLLFATNVAIELLEMGVCKDVVELYYSHSCDYNWDEMYFCEYKEIKEEE